MTITNNHPPATDHHDHWGERAACRGINPEIFFPTRANCADAYLAKKFCDACPVAPQCLTDALTNTRTCGVFAGHYFDQGTHKEITPPRVPPPDRSQLAKTRRTAAYERYQALIAEGLSPGSARRMIARRERVDESTVRLWIRKTRDENAAPHADKEN